jgi:hypothetical protein
MMLVTRRVLLPSINVHVHVQSTAACMRSDATYRARVHTCIPQCLARSVGLVSHDAAEFGPIDQILTWRNWNTIECIYSELSLKL